MQRLLSGYPADRVTLISGSTSFELAGGASGTGVKSQCIIVPTFSRRGRWGWGRLLAALDWCAVPFVAITALRVARKTKAKVLLSIAHGRFFVAAAIATRVSRVPLALWVHDDWVAMSKKNSFVLKYFARGIFRFAVRSASHVYAISESMAQWLRSEFQVESTVQMPAGELDDLPLEPNASDKRAVRIAFAGTCVAADETLKLLAKLVGAGMLLPDGRRVELHLYISRPEPSPVWDQPNIIFHPWLSQSALRSDLRKADILFLPYNFSQVDEFIPARSFPTKASDYMRAGRPILIMAPGWSEIVRYARAYGFAAIVDQCSEQQLVDAIRRLACDRAYQVSLADNAREVFKRNHNISLQRQEVAHMLQRVASIALSPNEVL